MRALPSFAFVFAALVCFVGAEDIWKQIEDADFTFVPTSGGGGRETKTIVFNYVSAFGVPLPGKQAGLFIGPGKDGLLDAMIPPLKRGLQHYTPTPLIETVLTDARNARKDVIATTENDYTHALHGMFMLVINTMLQAEPFATLSRKYKKQFHLTQLTPSLGAQRSVQSFGKSFFMPDWLISFSFPPTGPKRKSLLSEEILSTVEFKIGGKTFKDDCAFLDRFYAKGGSAVVIWSPAQGIPEGVIHYVPIINGAVVTDPEDLDQYDTMFDRVMEAAATALWADTKVTLFAAGSQYFAAGPARGYGLREEARQGTDTLAKRADVEDDNAKKSKISKIKAARAAFRKADAADKAFVALALSNKVPVSSKVIYLPSFGTKLRPANFLGHVLALTWDKLTNAFEESKLKLDHSVPASKKHALDVPSTTERPTKKPNNKSNRKSTTRSKAKRQDTTSSEMEKGISRTNSLEY